jgi:transposase InsO family protein
VHLLNTIHELTTRDIPTRDACTIVGISKSTYYRWRQRLQHGGPHALTPHSTRPKTHRIPWKQRLIAPHVEEARTPRTDDPTIHRVGKDKLAVLLARKGIHASASTVGRVIRTLTQRGVIDALPTVRTRTRTRSNAARRGHARRKTRDDRAQHPGQYIQIDTLHERSHPGRPRMHFTAIDPTNRFVHARLAPSATSRHAEAFLHEVLSTWPHPVQSIQIDNGSEFQGAFERACQTLGIPLVTIPPRTPKANAHEGRMQRTFRDEYYAFEPPSFTLEQANDHLNAYVHWYNHQRPHHALNLQSPMQYTHPTEPHVSQKS